jgi:alanyl-tRNA synthetase
VPARVEALLAKNQSLESQLAALADQARSADAAELAATAITIGEAAVVVTERSDLRPDELRLLAMAVRDRIASGVVLIGSAFGGKGALVGLVTKDLVDRGVSAAELVAAGAGFLGGGGSRDPELSQAGGPNGSNLGAALEAARESAERTLTEV